MIRFTSGDMFATPTDIRVNTVNCVGVMGAGVALAFKNRYPDMFREYKRECDKGNIRPGKLHVWRTLSDWVINFPTKRHWRDKSRYDDVEAGLVALREYLLKLGPVRLALPALGCGHGGLDWAKVSGMIRDHLEGLEAEIIVFDPADSHKIAKPGGYEQPPQWVVIYDDDELYPANLARLGIRELSYSGKTSAADWNSDVAVFLSSKPDDRETAAATGCVAELARPGLRFSLVMGTAASTQLAVLILEKGGSVTGWVPQGLDRFKAPQALCSGLADGQIRFVSVAKANQSWNPGFATKSSVAAVGSAKASLFVDPAPRWLSVLADQDVLNKEHFPFYLRYQNEVPEIAHQWQELHGRPIGRRSSDGRPNIEPILQSIAVDQATSSTATETVATTTPETSAALSEEPARHQHATPSTPQSHPKRLIEVDLPIRRISAHARREKSIRHGHISTLHIWWARRPLAACRAVICAALWPDPVDGNCPPVFRETAAKVILDFARKITADTKLANDHCSPENYKVWSTLVQKPPAVDSHGWLRAALLDFIADFANWDNSTVREYLDASRALTQAAHEALGGVPGTRPLVVDPFAGGGSIPLEALRVGADAFASDLNPVPVLLNKVVLEYVPKYGQHLADEVRKWGEWIKTEAEKELAEFYPKDADGATPIAYFWARTIISEAPGRDNAPIEVPLLRSMWLSKKGNRKFALRWKRDEKGAIRLQDILVKDTNGSERVILQPLLEVFQPSTVSDVEAGTSKGGSATCPVTGYTTPVESVRRQLLLRRGGASDARLLAVVVSAKDEAGRSYHLADKSDVEAFRRARDTFESKTLSGKSAVVLPEGKINHLRGFFNIVLYGMEHWGDLFSPRQAFVVTTFGRLVVELKDKLHVEQELAVAIQTCLALAVDRIAEKLTSVARWDVSRENPQGTFGRQALPMVWDFCEVNPFSGAGGDWSTALDWVAKVLELNATTSGSMCGVGHATQASATEHPLPDDSVATIFTDPPYYAAVPYADLSDFFYGWLKQTVGANFPSMFIESLAPKPRELVSLSHRAAMYREKTGAWFEARMAEACGEARRVCQPGGMGVIVFANKETAGWEAMLSALVSSGWIITASWPIDTEMGSRLRAQNSAALASSVHIVCRPRENSDGSVRTDEIGDWRDVLQELPRRIHEWMPRLAEEGVVGADAIFACLGPALEIYSRYSRVEKSNGDPVPLKDYLEHVWAAVSKEALSVIFAGANTEGFEPDARLTAMWLWTLAGPVRDPNATEGEGEEETDEQDEGSGKKGKTKGGFALEYDAARKIAQGLGAHLEDLRSMVEVSGETARLLPVAERTAYLFGKEQANEPLTAKRKKKQDAQIDLFAELAQPGISEQEWTEKTVSKIGETTLDRIHQSMILFAASRGEALKRFLVDDGAGRDQKFWRLAQALSALYPPKCEEKRWVDGVLARKKGLGL